MTDHADIRRRLLDLADRIQSDADRDLVLAGFNAIEALVRERDEAQNFAVRISDQLSEVINILRGPPPERVLWSRHDVADYARRVVSERDEARLERDEWKYAAKVEESERRRKYEAISLLREARGFVADWKCIDGTPSQVVTGLVARIDALLANKGRTT